MIVYLDVLFMDVASARGHWLSRLAWWGLLLTRWRRPRFVHVMSRYRLVRDNNDEDIYEPWVSLSPWGFNVYDDDYELALDVRLDTTEIISVRLGSVDSVERSGRWVFVDTLKKFNQAQTLHEPARFCIGALLTGLGISQWSHHMVCTDPVWWRLCGKVTNYGHLTPDTLRRFIQNEIYKVFW